MDSNWYLAFINYFGSQNVNSSSLADKDKGSIIGVDSVKKTDMKNEIVFSPFHQALYNRNIIGL